jgi:tetratricopeptide (TPR) repeat protein
MERFPNDQSFAASYAGILRAQGRYTDALAAYDESIQRFPFNLPSRLARADVFKRMNRRQEALLAYNNIIERHPHYAPAKAAKASVLILMGDLGAAEQLLSVERPKSQSEWSLMLLRAHLLEAKGRRGESRTLLEFGTRSPFARQRRLFKASLARLELEAGHGSAALDIIEAAEAAPGEITNVIRFHALAASGRRPSAEALFKHISASEIMYVDLSSEIARRFQMIVETPKYPREWIFHAESSAIVLEAAQ